MRSDIMNTTIYDLLSVPPLIFRGIRGKLIKTTLLSNDVDISLLHFEIMTLLRSEGALNATEISQRL